MLDPSRIGIPLDLQNNINNYQSHQYHTEEEDEEEDEEDEEEDDDEDDQDSSREQYHEFRQFIDNLVNQSITDDIFSNIENPLNNECPITQEAFSSNDRVGMINQCRHIFNRDAIHRWIRTNYVCPMCRHDIRNNSSGTFQRLTTEQIIERIQNFLNENEIPQNRSLIIRYYNPASQSDRPTGSSDS